MTAAWSALVSAIGSVIAWVGSMSGVGVALGIPLTVFAVRVALIIFFPIITLILPRLLEIE